MPGEDQGDDAMHVRAGDTSQGNEVKITREIPLWGILSVVGTLAAQGVSTYYGQQRLAETVERLGGEVRALTTSVNDLGRAQAGQQFQIIELQRRVDTLENRDRK